MNQELNHRGRLALVAREVILLTRVATVLLLSDPVWARMENTDNHANTGVLMDMGESRWWEHVSHEDVRFILLQWITNGTIVLDPRVPASWTFTS